MVTLLRDHVFARRQAHGHSLPAAAGNSVTMPPS